MTTPETGGAAFPNWHSGDITIKGGMTLRDYFAGQALMGILSALPEGLQHIEPHMKANYPTWAKVSFDIADAMIQERDRPMLAESRKEGGDEVL